jgi:hypothetical protein
LQSLLIASANTSRSSPERLILYSTVPLEVTVVALRPILDRAYQTLAVDAITPNGARVPLLLLEGPRPQWLRRYWLEQQVDLPSGSRIEVTATPLADYSDELNAAATLPLQIAVDYVSH